MKHPFVTLSENGCDRATAYITTNKIVRHDGRLYVGWLDAPAKPGQRFVSRLGICCEKTGEPRTILTLGRNYTDHDGPALAVDLNGRFHMILGAHHHPFLYRWSDTPETLSSWSEPVVLGPYDTYPSLAVDSEGTLHLAHRKMEHPCWELWYRRKPAGKPWEAPVVVAVSPLPGYSHFYQSLSVGPGGALHLLFQYCYTNTGASADARGRMAVHITSEDGGRNWFNEGSACRFPLTEKSVRPICHCPQGGVKISNHVVDEQNRAWFFTPLAEQTSGALFRQNEQGWETVNLPARLNELNMAGARETSMSRDASGTIHLAASARPDGGEAYWHHPALEIFHTRIRPDGGPGTVTQLSETSSQAASWLPAMEHWDWLRADQLTHASPAFAYTQGREHVRVGEMETIQTNVRLIPTI